MFRIELTKTDDFRLAVLRKLLEDTGDCFKEELPHFRLVVCVRVCDSEYTRYEVGERDEEEERSIT